MRKVQLTYKFRLYPKKEHEERLLETLELCRQTYNYFLAQWNEKAEIPSRLERPEPKPVEIGCLLSVPAQATVVGQVPSLKLEAPCVSLGYFAMLNKKAS